MDTFYEEDILGEGFQRTTLSLRDDYEGSAVATLVRRLSDTGNGRSVLYIHGFNDYFFQREMACRLNERSFHFYALDLRKYGRSWLSHQKFNDIRDIRAYFEEITLALQMIREEGSRTTVLLGHSTGGLIVTLYAKEHGDSSLFDGIMLNSPFFDFNKSWFVKKCIPFASFVGGFLPGIKIAGGFTEQYGKFLHRGSRGEWEYNLAWKPHVAPRINLGWVRAIHKAQRELRQPFEVRKPLLVLHSERSVSSFSDEEQVQSRDAILNVRDIQQVARNIRGQVEIVSVLGGLHDLVLSCKEVRGKVYQIMFDWLVRQNGTNDRNCPG